MKSGTIKTLLFSMIFGTLSGVILTVALSVLIPQFYTDWAGSLVCSGKVEYVSFKQTYLCRISPNNYSDVKDAIFWAVFKRILLAAIFLGFLLVLGFIKLAEFLWKRRAAAGF